VTLAREGAFWRVGLQTIALLGLRGVLIDHVLRTDLMLTGLAIDSLLFTGAAFAFAWLLASARRAGSRELRQYDAGRRSLRPQTNHPAGTRKDQPSHNPKSPLATPIERRINSTVR